MAWKDEIHTDKCSNTSATRGYIQMQELSQKFVEAHLVQASDYNNLTTNEVEPLLVDGKQLYYTSISGTQAFEYLTFVNPKQKYPSMAAENAEMYKACVRKVEAEYIKMEQLFEWSTKDNTYYVKTIYGTGDENGRGKYYFIKDADSGRFVYISRETGQEMGVAIKDEGTFQLTNGVLTKMYPVTVVTNLSEADNVPEGTIVFLKAGG